MCEILSAETSQNHAERYIISEKGLNFAEARIIFLLIPPVAGIIVWIKWHENKPTKAQEATLISILSIVLIDFLFGGIFSNDKIGLDSKRITNYKEL